MLLLFEIRSGLAVKPEDMESITSVVKIWSQ